MSELTEVQEKGLQVRTPIEHMIESIERMATNPDMNPANLEKMLDMQERILNRQEQHEYNAAMVACQSAIPKVSKNTTGEKGAYANLENVIDVAGPIWAEHGFALEFFEGDSPVGMVRVCCDVRHIGGHVEHRKLDMPLDNLGPKGQPNKTATQGTGSSFSYGKRYLSCGIFNIATGDDNDGNSPVAEFITAEQKQTIIKLIQETNADTLKFLAAMGGAESVDELPSDIYDKALRMLNKKKRAKNGNS